MKSCIFGGAKRTHTFVHCRDLGTGAAAACCLFGRRKYEYTQGEKAEKGEEGVSYVLLLLFLVCTRLATVCWWLLLLLPLFNDPPTNKAGVCVHSTSKRCPPRGNDDVIRLLLTHVTPYVQLSGGMI